jgi:hypothetical protein
MKPLLVLAVAASIALDASALPKVGYYKSYYSADHGAYHCAQVTSNNKQVKIGTKKVTYFEMVTGDGVALACIPKVFSDTDDTAVDGDPVRTIFSSSATAMCSPADGSGGSEVEFDETHVFWGGASIGQVALPGGTVGLGLQKERQTNFSEFYSASACPP